MAKKFNSVVVLMQKLPFIHEENETDSKCKEPQLTQLIEYKDLIREIDTVIFTYRESNEGSVKLIVPLNKSGMCGYINCGFVKGCNRLFDHNAIPSVSNILRSL